MKKAFKVLNIKCEGCANSIKKALSLYFDFIEVDLTKEPRIVTVEIKEEKDEEELKRVLRTLGYPLIDDKLSKTQEIGMKTKSFISCAVGKFTLSKE